MVFPTELHQRLAACTMEERRAFSPVSKDVVPWGELDASAATGEQVEAVESKPSALCTRPSMLVNGISVALGAPDTLKVAVIGVALVELPTSIVMAPGGRMDVRTTSARNRFRVP